jgi:outer membrane lipoprotein LolB
MRRLRVMAGALLLSVLAGCTTVGGPVPIPAATVDDTTFAIGGRLSARHGGDGVAGNFTWTHEPGGDRLDVATPLGQTIARLAGDASGVHLERPNGAIERFANWDALTREVFGVAIPVQGLARWIRGAPVAGAPADIESDAQRRPSVIRQRGWEIVYTYPEAAPASRPARLVMRYAGADPVEVRIVVDRWTADAAP